MPVPPTFDPTAPGAPFARRWTVASGVEVRGVGVHSGITTRVVVRPAEAGVGLRFRRVDVGGCPEIPALARWVVATRLSTSLGVGDVRVATVEHLLAALWGLGFTDAWVDVDGPEVPIVDGSALPFVEALRAAGATALEGARPVLRLPACGVAEGDRSVTSLPGEEARYAVAVDYGRPPLGAALASGVLSPAHFAAAIAPARTFAREADVVAMREAGLARGGSLGTAVIATDAGFSSALRFPDEPVRHKVLDLVGDLALLGGGWLGSVVAFKAGHALHTRYAAAVGEAGRT
ncbi:MAG: UDP-3-O-acyl-N-acetylglucosamine deacetylase [Candidatus Sericytochromatia bacterium]|nr:UDP-3-O-acyl-N-acetylglucosamine deacetylase [Candidatus Sericytochromatia bacterium]